MSFYFKKFKIRNLFVGLLITLEAIFLISGTIFVANMINALVAQRIQNFIFWMLMVAVMQLVYMVTERVKVVQLESIIQDQLNAVREDIVDGLSRMEYRQFQTNSKEAYNSWLHNDMTILCDEGFRQIYSAYEGIIMMLLASAAIIYFHWLLLIVTLLLTVTLFYLPRLFEKKLEKATKEVSAASKEALDKTTDYLEGYEIFLRNNQRQYFKGNLLQIFKKLRTIKIDRTKVSANISLVLSGTVSIAQSVTLALAGFLIVTHQLQIGAIVAIANLSGSIFIYSKNITKNFITAKTTNKLLEKYPQLADFPKITEAVEPYRPLQLAFEDLSVSFENREIHYPDFTLKAGKKYALVGESGSGKSTLAAVLMGELDNYQGKILLDGKNFRLLETARLRETISLVSQFPYLFRETIEDNLKIGRKIDSYLWTKSSSA